MKISECCAPFSVSQLSNRMVRTCAGRPGGARRGNTRCALIRRYVQRHTHRRCIIQNFFPSHPCAAHLWIQEAGGWRRSADAAAAMVYTPSRIRYDGRTGNLQTVSSTKRNESVGRGRTCCIEARPVTPRTFFAQMIAAGAVPGRLEERREREKMKLGDENKGTGK